MKTKSQPKKEHARAAFAEFAATLFSLPLGKLSHKQLTEGLTRFYLLGGWSLILGIGLSRLPAPEETMSGVLYGLTGLAMAISGGLVLATYLRRNRMPPQDTQL